ncbi:histidine phosphatase family protein [Erysipelotrichaceae bacterium RD49]|nr:histidine phosphatase family protein [Erysipelotrichaceae bacterium RD49]
MRKAIFIRHGQTQSDVTGIKGRIDVDLSQEGIQQMAMIGYILSKQGQKPDLIVTSPLKRAQVAGQIINPGNLIQLLSEQVNELDLGQMAGQISELDLEKYEQERKQYHAESIREAIDRAMSLLNDLKDSEFQCVAIISHSILMTLLYQSLPKAQGLPASIPMLHGCGFEVSLEPEFKVINLFPDTLLDSLKDSGWPLDQKIGLPL